MLGLGLNWYKKISGRKKRSWHVLRVFGIVGDSLMHFLHQFKSTHKRSFQVMQKDI